MRSRDKFSKDSLFHGVSMPETEVYLKAGPAGLVAAGGQLGSRVHVNREGVGE
mgnify:CR=1 FL=1